MTKQCRGEEPTHGGEFVRASERNRLAQPTRYPDIKSLRGVAGSLAKPVSWREMREIAYEDRLYAKWRKLDW